MNLPRAICHPFGKLEFNIVKRAYLTTRRSRALVFTNTSMPHCTSHISLLFGISHISHNVPTPIYIAPSKRALKRKSKLRALAGAVNPFESDEEAGLHCSLALCQLSVVSCAGRDCGLQGLGFRSHPLGSAMSPEPINGRRTTDVFLILHPNTRRVAVTSCERARQRMVEWHRFNSSSGIGNVRPARPR